MATIYQTAAAAIKAAGYNKPAVFEQMANYVLTGLGHDAKGSDNTRKYIGMSPTYNIAAGAIVFFLIPGITDPVGLEKVGQLALTGT